MTNFNSTKNIEKNQEKITTINSLDDVKKFLETKSVKQFVIQKVITSFMAKITPKTPIDLKENTLHIGESKLYLGEDIYSNINNITTNTQEKVAGLLASGSKKLLPANDKIMLKAA